MSILARVFLLLAFLLCIIIGVTFIGKVHNNLAQWVATVLDGNDSQLIPYHMHSI